MPSRTWLSCPSVRRENTAGRGCHGASLHTCTVPRGIVDTEQGDQGGKLSRWCRSETICESKHRAWDE